MSAPEPIYMTLAEAIEAGYAVTSRRYRHASRLDREDWREVVNEHLHRSTLDADAADWYRRILSKDVVIVPKDWIGESMRQYQALQAGLFLPGKLPASRVCNFTSYRPMLGPGCGHSACRQNWIDTGDRACVEGEFT